MNTYLGLGSNLGSRKQHLQQAVFELENSAANKVLKISSIYETEPVGYVAQPWFLNLVLEMHTNLNPYELLQFVKEIESKVGRKETFKWGPRVVDIDILVYGNKIIKSRQLIIPHPEIHARRFVLLPLSEISPNFIHPEKKLSIKQMLATCSDNCVKWHSNFKRIREGD